MCRPAHCLAACSTYGSQSCFTGRIHTEKTMLHCHSSQGILAAWTACTACSWQPTHGLTVPCPLGERLIASYLGITFAGSMLPRSTIVVVTIRFPPCPSRLKSLRLEAYQYYEDKCSCSNLTGGFSSLLSLEKLHFLGFHVLGSQPAQVAAALRPLRRLQALVGDATSTYCQA